MQPDTGTIAEQSRIGIAPDPSFEMSDLIPLPEEFDFVAHDVPIQSLTGNTLAALVAESLPGAILQSVRRFGNKRLWSKYSACKATLNGGAANVHLLFHGTKEPSLVIGNGLEGNSDGFDFRRSHAGSYGKGAYFALSAAYPIRIHPRRQNADGTFSLIVAEVALGQCKDMGCATDNTLVVPPERRPGLLYDSVCGTEAGIGTRFSTDDLHGKQYVVYNNDQAYPHFLITVECTMCTARTIVESTIRLSSVHFPMQYMYAADRSDVFIWKGKVTNGTLSKARFQVEPVDGHLDQVRLRSVHFSDKYVYAPEVDFKHSDDPTDGPSRRRQLRMSKGAISEDTLARARFVVEPVAGFSNQIRLKSIHFDGQYVYAPEIDKECADDPPGGPSKRRECLICKETASADVLSKARFEVCRVDA